MCKAFTLGRRFPRARPQPPYKQALSACFLRGLWTRAVPAGVVCLPFQPAIDEDKQTTRISMQFCSLQGFLIQPLLFLLKSSLSLHIISYRLFFRLIYLCNVSSRFSCDT